MPSRRRKADAHRKASARGGAQRRISRGFGVSHGLMVLLVGTGCSFTPTWVVGLPAAQGWGFPRALDGRGHMVCGHGPGYPRAAYPP